MSEGKHRQIAENDKGIDGLVELNRVEMSYTSGER